MKPCTKFEERISEMLFGEVPENESQKLHIHMAACDGCMNFYLSLYETLETGEGEDFSLTQGQKKEIFEEAEKLDKPIKKLSPLWTTGVSVAASLVVSGLVIMSDSNLSGQKFSDSKEPLVEIEVVMDELHELELEAPMENASKSAVYDSNKASEFRTKEYKALERQRREAPAKKQSKSFDYEKLGKKENEEILEADTSSPVLTTVAIENVETNDMALEDTNDDAPSTDDNMLDQAVSDVVVSPSAFVSPSVYGGRSRASRASEKSKFKNEEKKDSLKMVEESLNLVVEDKEPAQGIGNGVAGLDAGGGDLVAGIGDVAGGEEEYKGKSKYEDGHVQVGPAIDSLENDPFAEADPKALDNDTVTFFNYDSNGRADLDYSSNLYFSSEDGKKGNSDNLLFEKSKLELTISNDPFSEKDVKRLEEVNKEIHKNGKSRKRSNQEYVDNVEWKWSVAGDARSSNHLDQLGKDIHKQKPAKVDEIIRQNPELVFHGLYLESKQLISEGKIEEAEKQIKEAARWSKAIAKTPDNEKRLSELASFVREKKMREKAENLKGEMKRLKELRDKDSSKAKVDPAQRPMLSTQEKPMSTFSIDVDTASYQMAKQVIQNGSRPDPLSIRAEEFINSFNYKYEAPKTKAFKVQSEVVNSPFHRGSKIMKIGVQGKRPGGDHRAASHFCFIVDTSGSMADESRLPMVKKVLPMIVNQMSPGDKVSLVSCGLKSRLEMDYVDVKNADFVKRRIESLNAVGATNLEASLIDGYQQVLKHTKKGTYSRVILFSDGVANLGEKNADNILQTLRHAKEKGAGITVIGMGEEEYNDNFLETLADKGDGNYVFIGNNKEARKTFEEKFAATFHTIAYNVKIQVEFDPNQVSKYRLLGYENRRLKNKDFRNDRVDAGEVGSGQSVTAIYEVETTGTPSAKPMAEIRLRYRDAVDNKMHEFATPVLQKSYNVDFENSTEATRLSLICGKFAEVLRDGGSSEGITSEDLLKYLRPLASQMEDPDVNELLNLIEKSR